MNDFGIKLIVKCDFEEFLDKVDSFSESTNYGYNIEENNGEIWVNVEVFPYMPLVFKQVDDAMEMSVDTCFYGVGYHLILIEFIAQFVEYIGFEFEFEDETNYVDDDDKEKLEKLYDEWIYENAKYVLANREDDYARATFVRDKRLLPVKEDYVCAYTGIISLTEFEELFLDNLEGLKERVFVFPKEIDNEFESEGFLLYHIWNNLKDLTIVDDFDERASLAKFMFENVTKTGIKIHLPQKFSREIYKYLGVDGFSASNFMYRKVKYDVGYQNFDKLILDYDVTFKLPTGFLWNKDVAGYVSAYNSVFINEYSSEEVLEFNTKIVDEINYMDFKAEFYETLNEGNMFLGYDDEIEDDYNYIPFEEQNKELPESTSLQLICKDKKYEIVVYGENSVNVLKYMIGL